MTIGEVPVGGRFMFEGKEWQKVDQIKIARVVDLEQYPSDLEVGRVHAYELTLPSWTRGLAE